MSSRTYSRGNPASVREKEISTEPSENGFSYEHPSIIAKPKSKLAAPLRYDALFVVNVALSS